MRYAKFLLNDFAKESRDKREVATVRNLGWDVTVLSPVRCAEIGDGVSFLPLKSTNVAFQQSWINRKFIVLKNWKNYITEIREQQFDIISCHDLTALLLGYVSAKGCKKVPKLVYDAHEFEIGRATGGRRGRLGVWWVTHLERFLMRRCAFSIAVNDSIADEMVRVHRLSERPVVVRSTPYLWERDEAAVRAARESFCSELGADPDEACVVMYHGAVVRGRGVEQVIRAAAADPAVCVVVMGDGNASYLAELKELAEGSGASERVAFRSAVPREDLEAWVAGADVGMVVLENVCMNHYFTLPNKFFENVQAETPIVASDFPETSRLIERYGIGLTCDPSDVAEIASCIERLREDRGLYGECKSNLKAAKRELCWERERDALEEAYAKAVCR